MTKIEWTDDTWNPIVGCSVVSPGCTNCYAMRMAARLEKIGIPHYKGLTKTVNGNPVWTGKLALAPEKTLTEPLRWRKPRRIFVNSMGDLFHEHCPDDWIDRLWDVMERCPQHQFQVLTKRARRMREYMSNREMSDFDHIWLGVSVENQEQADARIPELLSTPAAVRFVSVEPMLGPVNLETWRGERCEPDDTRYIDHLDWIICGGESGHGARPFDLAWARSIVAQCKAAGVPCFVKQIGRRPQGEWKPGQGFIPSADPWWSLENKKGGDPAEWPTDLRVREFPTTRQET